MLSNVGINFYHMHRSEEIVAAAHVTSFVCRNSVKLPGIGMLQEPCSRLMHHRAGSAVAKITLTLLP